MAGLSKSEWKQKLCAISESLDGQGRHAQLMVIGSWPAIEDGMPGRTSLDLDVWVEGSDFIEPVLVRACADAGLLFNPTQPEEELDGQTPYLQLVEPGIVQVPDRPPRSKVNLGALKILVPPPAALIASKLTRAAPKDLDDCLYLQHRHGVREAAIRDAIDAFSDAFAKQTAIENLVLLRVRAAQ